jgi:hypothetical protein
LLEEGDAAAECLAVVVDLGNENGKEDMLVDELGGAEPKAKGGFDAGSVLLVRPAPSVGLSAAVGLKGGSPPKEGVEEVVPFADDSEVEGADSFGFVVGSLNENPPVPPLAGAALDVLEGVDLVPLNGGIACILGVEEKEKPPVDSVAGVLNANEPVGTHGGGVGGTAGPVDVLEDVAWQG